MGQEVVVSIRPSASTVADLLATLSSQSWETTVMMVDGALVMPRAPVSPAWRDLRLRTPGGTVTLSRRDRGIAVVVFGNAEPQLLAAQQRIAAALAALAAAASGSENGGAA